jgi:hypothetical protein
MPEPYRDEFEQLVAAYSRMSDPRLRYFYVMLGDAISSFSQSMMPIMLREAAEQGRRHNKKTGARSGPHRRKTA